DLSERLEKRSSGRRASGAARTGGCGVAFPSRASTKSDAGRSGGGEVAGCAGAQPNEAGQSRTGRGQELRRTTAAKRRGAISKEHESSVAGRAGDGARADLRNARATGRTDSPIGSNPRGGTGEKISRRAGRLSAGGCRSADGAGVHADRGEQG